MHVNILYMLVYKFDACKIFLFLYQKIIILEFVALSDILYIDSETSPTAI